LGLSERSNPADRLRWRYLASLGLVALLAVGGTLAIRVLVGGLEADAPAINDAGRQRMLSQRLAKDVVRLRYAASQETLALQRPQIRETLVAWAQGQERLRQEVVALAAPFSDPALRAALARVDRSYRLIHGLAEELLEASGAKPATPRDRAALERAADRILEHEPAYLTEMDHMVSLYEEKASSRVAWLQRGGLLLTSSVLLVLACAGLFVLEPAVRLIRRQFHEASRLLEEERNAQYQLAVRNRFIEEVFGRYLSDDVVHQLLDTPKGLELGGEERNVTLLMADLRGFTALAATLDPQQAIRLLNHYLGSMTRVVMTHHGTINEFLGDCIFAVFGAPLSTEYDARSAASCAIDMQVAMAGVNQTLQREGLPELEIGIAIHSGRVVAGNIGCSRRAKYGVVGAAVNLTSRLEACALGGQVLVSESTLKELEGEVEVGARLQLRVKGFEAPVNAYALIGLKGGLYLAPVEKEERFACLREGFPIGYRRIAEKQVGQVTFTGTIARISSQQAEIRPTREDRCPTCRSEVLAPAPVIVVEPWEDIELLLNQRGERDFATLMYAKVTEVVNGKDPMFRVSFTSVPPAAGAIVSGLVARGEP
jgi:class 3 adenylate cyclase